MPFLKLLVIPFFLLTTIHSTAQNSTHETKTDSLLLPEVFPAFPGGAIEWQKFLQKNLNPEVPVDFGANVGHYIVKVRFIVNVDSTVSSIEALTKFGYGMETEVIRE